MKRLIPLCLVLAIVAACSNEPESRYRMEYNDVTKEYRISCWDKDRWNPDRMMPTKFVEYKSGVTTELPLLQIVKIDWMSRESVQGYLDELRREEIRGKESENKRRMIRKAWRVVE